MNSIFYIVRGAFIATNAPVSNAIGNTIILHVEANK